jgi:galactokinase
LSDSPYNRRRQECAEALELARIVLDRELPGLAMLTQEDVPRLEPTLDATLLRRVRHVVSEQARVRLAVEALGDGDIEALGQLLWQSHASLRDDFEVSCPELDLVVDLAAGTEGVLGARLTGAGFGGCTVHLVREEALDAFRGRVVGRYRSKTGLPAEAYVVAASDGLRAWPAA